MLVITTLFERKTGNVHGIFIMESEKERQPIKSNFSYGCPGDRFNLWFAWNKKLSLKEILKTLKQAKRIGLV